MKKYLVVFAIDWQSQFVYRLNFVLWRFRNVLRLLMTFFLWDVIFSSRTEAFGYTREQMMGYVFLVLIVQTLVMAAPSNDNIGGEIGSGDLSNYLVKPVNYIKYWFVRDLSSKLINILFASVEILILFLIIRPEIYISLQPHSIFFGLLAWIMGIFIYFFITKIAVFGAFWVPENTWGLMFLILVMMEMLGGTIFPLDVLPSWAQTALQFTPFPYLIYYPITIFVGKTQGALLVKVLILSTFWLLFTYFMVVKVWQKGLKNYSAVGR